MAVSREETINKLIDIVSDKLNISRDTITPTSSFKDLGADSLDIVELIMTFEEIFNIEISDEAAESITTIQDAVNHIDKGSGAG